MTLRRPGHPFLFAQMTALITALLGVTVAPPLRADERFGEQALSAYCEGYQQALAAIRDADLKFGIEGTDEKLLWIKERDAAIFAAVEDELGAPAADWRPIADVEHWDQRCEARARGWLEIEVGDLQAAKVGDAFVISRVLSAVYADKLARRDGLPFSDDRYTRAGCDRRETDGYQIVGCMLSGGSFFSTFNSDPYIFLIARKDGASVIVPYDHEARDHMTSPSYTDVDAGKTVMPVGWYLDPPPPVPYRDVRALFE